MGLGGVLLGFLESPLSIDGLWYKYSKINNSKKYPAYHSFDNVILALGYLFIIGAVDFNKNGEIVLCA